jgi:hypothetical protein
VRGQVLTDFKNRRLQTASEGFYSQLRRRYQVEVDKAALVAAESQRLPSSVSSGSQGAGVPDVD